MGNRGPVPKRSDQRLGHGSPRPTADKVPAAPKVIIPKAAETWHPIASAWYESLAQSGQSRFYEPSDWATAFLIAESISRDLNPQFVGITLQGDMEYESIPLKGASLNAYLKAMSSLMVTEGDRRRLNIELQREQPDTRAADKRMNGIVTDIASRRGRIAAG